ncbi:hypothetical protein [Corallibacter sp.]|uniref:hypothetical protein n=1 Tax=Corallibacter sp. TaxID=2038084 RepID=UPI003AB578B9
MLTKQDKQLLRGTIFKHLDGIATATSAYTLYKNGVLNSLLEKEQDTTKSLANIHHANEG